MLTGGRAYTHVGCLLVASACCQRVPVRPQQIALGMTQALVRREPAGRAPGAALDHDTRRKQRACMTAHPIDAQQIEQQLIAALVLHHREAVLIRAVAPGLGAARVGQGGQQAGAAAPLRQDEIAAVDRQAVDEAGLGCSGVAAARARGPQIDTVVLRRSRTCRFQLSIRDHVIAR